MISYSQSVQLVPTVSAAAYASGNVIGGLLTFPGAARGSGWGGLIQSITAMFASGITPVLDVIIFSTAPTGSVITDKTAISIVASDLDVVQGVMHLNDVTSLGSTSLVQSQQQAMPFDLVNGNILYAAVVTRSAVTLGSTSDMTISIQVLQN